MQSVDECFDIVKEDYLKFLSKEKIYKKSISSHIKILKKIYIPIAFWINRKYKQKGNKENSLDSWIEKIRDLLENPESNAIDFIDDSLASRSSVEGSYPSEEGEENFFKRNTGAISDSMSNSQENLLSAFIPPKPTKPDLDADIGEVSFPNALEIEEKRSKLEGEEKIKEIDLVRPSLFELVTRTGKAAIGLSKGAEPKKINPILSNKEEDKVEKSVRDFDLNHSTAIEPKNLGESPEVAEPQAESELLPLKSLDEVSLEETRKDLNQETNHVPNLELNQEQDDLLDIPAFLRRQAN